MVKYPVRKRLRKIGNSNFLLIPSYFFDQGILEEGQELRVTIHTTADDDMGEVDIYGESDNGKDDD